MKKFFKFLSKNYFVFFLLFAIFFVGLFSIYKLFFSKPTYVYAKIKVGQGLWWASTIKPSYWFVNALKNNSETEKDLTGKSIVKIINVTYYPTSDPNQYNIYVTARLLVSRLGKTENYSFNRSTIGVGSPIDIELPSIQFSGTIIDLNSQLFKDQFVEKTIYMTKTSALPWESDSIKIGDKYFDGQRNVFEVLDKSQSNSILSPYGIRIDISIKARIEVQKINDELIFGEEEIVNPGKYLTISTNSFTFDSYVISKIE